MLKSNTPTHHTAQDSNKPIPTGKALPDELPNTREMIVATSNQDDQVKTIPTQSNHDRIKEQKDTAAHNATEPTLAKLSTEARHLTPQAHITLSTKSTSISEELSQV